jgi:Mce-associated membrane protein
VLAVLAVAGVVAGAVALARPSPADLRDSALSAARSYVQTVTTFDARTLDEDVAAVRRLSTDEFAAEYEETIAAVRDQVLAEQTVSVGEVVAVGLERLEGDEAVALVAVNAEITGAGQPPRTEANRVRIALVREDGSWLIRGIDRL